MLSELKSLGVRLSVDDFGTGYSSLSRLQQFPVDSLKIDRAFISHMDTDAESYKIVQVIIMLAQTLGGVTGSIKVFSGESSRGRRRGATEVLTIILRGCD